MKIDPKSIPIERYIAMDIHKHYVVVGGMDPQKEWVLRPRKVRMSRFSEWVLKNLNSSDAVVIESTSNAWEIYDLIAPVVRKTVVANPLKVGQIAGAKVKTDRLDVERLLTLLIADIVPEVWVPPHHVRDLRSLISHRWCIQKQITMTKNRLQSFIHRFNLLPPEGKLFSEDNRSWWEEQEFSTMENSCSSHQERARIFHYGSFSNRTRFAADGASHRAQKGYSSGVGLLEQSRSLG